MKTYLRTLKLIKEEKPLAVFLMTACLILAAVMIIEPFFFREIVDKLSNFTGQSDFWNQLLSIFIFWGIVVATNIVFQIGVTYYSSYMANKIYWKLWNKTLEHILGLSLGFFQNVRMGSVIRNFERGLDNIYSLLINFFRQIMPNVFVIIILFPILFYLNTEMALLILAMVPILLALVFWGTNKTRKNQQIADLNWVELSGIAYDSVSNIPLIKSFTLKKDILAKVIRKSGVAYKKQIEAIKWWGFVIGFSRSVGVFLNVLVFLLGAYLYVNSTISIGSIIMFLGFSNILINMFNALFWSVLDYSWQREKIIAFFSLTDEEPSIKNAKDAIKIGKAKGRIEFKNVFFSYSDELEAIKDVSFKINPGEVVAFVGHTGSGKSTTANLISRFYDIKSGKILIDGIDIERMDIDSLRKNISIVFQDSTFLNTTFHENLKINKNISIKDIEKACRQAYIWDLISKNKKGLREVVGDRGVKLSGGEKQRLSIARAILKDAPILILDEATSSLDAKTENKIQMALSNLIKEKTTIIIAHRLSTIKSVDRIFVFKGGRVVETGTFSELMAKKGYFYDLASHQITI